MIFSQDIIHTAYNHILQSFPEFDCTEEFFADIFEQDSQTKASFLNDFFKTTVGNHIVFFLSLSHRDGMASIMPGFILPSRLLEPESDALTCYRSCLNVGLAAPYEIIVENNIPFILADTHGSLSVTFACLNFKAILQKSETMADFIHSERFIDIFQDFITYKKLTLDNPEKVTENIKKVVLEFTHGVGREFERYLQFEKLQAHSELSQ